MGYIAGHVHFPSFYEPEFEEFEACSCRFKPRKQRVDMEKIADDDELALLYDHAGDNFGVKPADGFITILFRAYPFAVFRVINNDKFGPVLEMPQPSNLLPRERARMRSPSKARCFASAIPRLRPVTKSPQSPCRESRRSPA